MFGALMGLLAAATAYGIYQKKNNDKKEKNAQQYWNSQINKTNNSNTQDASAAKNVYNYYATNSESGNTLFSSQKKTKRTLFGVEDIKQ